ncbi:SCP2 sterol-binding domain-containing protein [Limimaricola pyoseonensis]|uniref:SCP-2 sterol transfer family protein n=1 Tax=Limimaricola pyoseonensis TaxID=521013 RepID=A0A1G7D2K1_9RHOB|nr:SCP2 sterol-binding domain-containing protein [Limimaricola pyoseonensis]SDE45812.1 SCP-2 sterol transfer family protein [Limimaricola pyoseonensis]
MSELVNQAVTALNAKMNGDGLDGGPAKFVIEDEGAIMIDENGARAGDEAAEVTLSADAETFKAILEDELDPTAAFMQGKLSVDGDMGLAMKLAAVLG